jgi:hypothetical protein
LEFDREPFHQAADLGPVQRRAAQQRGIRVGILQVLADHPGAGNHRTVLVDQHRNLTRRTERQEALAPLPDLLGAKLAVEAFLCQVNARLTAGGVEREVIEDTHGRRL